MGEQTMAEQFANTSYTLPYKFNGKELDTETGLYYYGARYYDPRTSVWLGVDPLAGKYPGLSPYNYCANNPVMLIDPNGKDIDPATEQNVAHLINKESKTYNEAFAKQYDKLKNDHSTVYSFNEKARPWKNEKGKKVYGDVTYNGDNERGQYKIGINYTKKTGSSGLSSSSPLFEETFHAGQFSDGKFGFFRSTGKAFGLDIFDEAQAKLFAAIHTPDTKFDLEKDMLKAYNKEQRIENVVDFINKRPSLVGYELIGQEELNVSDCLDSIENQKILPFFDSNGNSTIKNLIMRKPK